jgi:type IV pilus assembly protein PilC
MATRKTRKLVEFAWEGVDARRIKASGDVEAPTITEARIALRRRGVRVTRIRRKPKPLFSFTKRIRSTDISFASRQMATMIGAGIPVAQTLQGIGKGHEIAAMQKLMRAIQTEVESGTSLSQALAKHPAHFDRLYTSLVAAGEESGKLDTMLEQVASYKEKIEAIKSKVKAAMMYPTVVLSIAIVVVILLLLFVIPQFEALFINFGAELPTLTRLIVDASKWFQQYWYIFFIFVTVGVVVFVYSYKRSSKMQYSLDRLVLKLPVIGDIMNKSAIARFARTQAITFAAGVPLVDGLDTVAAATGNRVYELAIKGIKAEVSTGRSLENSMAASGVFPNMVLQMVSSGEESGELELMLIKVAEFYEREVDDAVEALSSLIEPIMIVILGLIIGTMVIAMYLPIFKMAAVF